MVLVIKNDKKNLKKLILLSIIIKLINFLTKFIIQSISNLFY